MTATAKDVVSRALNHLDETAGPAAARAVSEKLLEKTELPTLEHLQNKHRALAVLLASLAVEVRQLGYFYEHSEQFPEHNPFDPIGQTDEFVDYLLFTWARGRPAFRNAFLEHRQPMAAYQGYTVD